MYFNKLIDAANDKLVVEIHKYVDYFQIQSVQNFLDIEIPTKSQKIL